SWRGTVAAGAGCAVSDRARPPGATILAFRCKRQPELFIGTMLAHRVFLAGLLSVTFPAIMSAEKLFSFNETLGKLPKEVVPVEYTIRIVPNIDRFAFTGMETVKLSVRTPVRQLVLNALELEITEASVDDVALPKSAIKIDKEKELLTLALLSELKPGDHTLALHFEGKINEAGQGLFYMHYQEQASGATKLMLGTQFEATHARRFFPCWDEPAFRARFRLTVVVPENWLAVSNMPIESETLLNGRDPAAAGGRPRLHTSSGAPGGRALPSRKPMKEVRFAPTPPMSSYLNVFVAGELDFIQSQVGPTQIRVIATKGKAELGRYALDASAEILKYYNDYFGVPYPLPKLDQIAL